MYYKRYIWGAPQNLNKMRYITIVGKPGCLKCSKMETVLKSRGCETVLSYIDKIGKIEIDDVEINATEDTHFPLYIYEGILYDSYGTLSKILNGYTRNEC